MRQRALKIRQVFAELRNALGNEIPAIELLQLAARLVDATRSPNVRDDEAVIRVRPSIDELPLDKAFADGGWEIMARDHAYRFEQFDEDPCVGAGAQSTLDRLMKRAA
jgi:hypothetical protein